MEIDIGQGDGAHIVAPAIARRLAVKRVSNEARFAAGETVACESIDIGERAGDARTLRREVGIGVVVAQRLDALQSRHRALDEVG